MDGCRGGWVAVVLAPSAVTAAFVERLDEVRALAPDAAVIGVDMPLALPASGRRQAEIAAREVLGPRRSSIFFTPPRAALSAADHAEASAISARVTGHGMSIQSWHLLPKIREAMTFADACAADGDDVHVREVHPELSFTHLLGQPATHGKATWAGQRERLSALTAVGIDLAAADAATGPAAPDDVVDAAVAAWSAGRIAAGTAVPHPSPPEPDDRGRPSAIWA